MSAYLFNPQSGECPFCRGDVPPEAIKLRATFHCPHCENLLKTSGTYEVVIRLTAIAIGFAIARIVGLDGLLLFCFGLIIAPFLVIPVWRGVTLFIRPILVASSEGVNTLNLRG
jgi:hypothetical protein